MLYESQTQIRNMAMVMATTMANMKHGHGTCMHAALPPCLRPHPPVLTATPTCLPSHLLIDLVIEW